MDACSCKYATAARHTRRCSGFRSGAAAPLPGGILLLRADKGIVVVVRQRLERRRPPAPSAPAGARVGVHAVRLAGGSAGRPSAPVSMSAAGPGARPSRPTERGTGRAASAPPPTTRQRGSGRFATPCPSHPWARRHAPPRPRRRDRGAWRRAPTRSPRASELPHARGGVHRSSRRSPVDGRALLEELAREIERFRSWSSSSPPPAGLSAAQRLELPRRRPVRRHHRAVTSSHLKPRSEDHIVARRSCAMRRRPGRRGLAVHGAAACRDSSSPPPAGLLVVAPGQEGQTAAPTPTKAATRAADAERSRRAAQRSERLPLGREGAGRRRGSACGSLPPERWHASWRGGASPGASTESEGGRPGARCARRRFRPPEGGCRRARSSARPCLGRSSSPICTPEKTRRRRRFQAPAHDTRTLQRRVRGSACRR